MMVPSGIFRFVASAAGYEVRAGARPSGEVMSRYVDMFTRCEAYRGVGDVYYMCEIAHVRKLGASVDTLE